MHLSNNSIAKYYEGETDGKEEAALRVRVRQTARLLRGRALAGYCSYWGSGSSSITWV